MSTSQDLALAFMLASYQESQAVTAEVKESKAEPSPPPRSPPTIRGLGIALPPKGSLDALGFFRAVHRAGVRHDESGLPYTDEREIRNDLIKAIHAYVGYDPTGQFGYQERLAREHAWRSIRPVKGISRAETRAYLRSLPGHTPGMPSYLDKRRGDLLARERVAAEDMLEYQRQAEDTNLSQADRLLASGMAAVERERLDQIQRDLLNLPTLH